MSYSKRRCPPRIDIINDIFTDNYRDSLESSISQASSMLPRNYYDLLELTPSASETNIKRAFQKQALKTHPDKGGSQESFLKLMRAYKILSNPVTKEIYDNEGERALNDFLEYYF